MAKRKTKTLPQLKEDLWKVFSKFIRMSDAGTSGLCRCYTCGKIKHWKYMDAGHWRSRQFNATLFDERNVHAQCKQCNGPYKGRPEEYRRHLIEQYGEGIDDELYALSRTTKKFTRDELNEMMTHYKKQVKQMEKYL